MSAGEDKGVTTGVTQGDSVTERVTHVSLVPLHTAGVGSASSSRNVQGGSNNGTDHAVGS
jgi:hypothetical protein